MNKNELVAAITAMRGTATDEEALQGIALYPHWKEDITVAENARYQYNGDLYRVVQTHTTQADWQPDVTPALWVKVSLDEWPEWVQPTGSHDAYNKGDKVTHNGVKYISLVDANVWEPETSETLWEVVE